MPPSTSQGKTIPGKWVYGCGETAPKRATIVAVKALAETIDTVQKNEQYVNDLNASEVKPEIRQDVDRTINRARQTGTFPGVPREPQWKCVVCCKNNFANNLYCRCGTAASKTVVDAAVKAVVAVLEKAPRKSTTAPEPQKSDRNVFASGKVESWVAAPKPAAPKPADDETSTIADSTVANTECLAEDDWSVPAVGEDWTPVPQKKVQKDEATKLAERRFEAYVDSYHLNRKQTKEQLLRAQTSAMLAKEATKRAERKFEAYVRSLPTAEEQRKARQEMASFAC